MTTPSQLKAIEQAINILKEAKIERANHECYYCMGCNTQDEIDRWQKCHE